MKECNNGRQIGICEVELRHSSIRAPGANYRADFVPADVLFHDLGARQVRAGLATGSVASMTKAALGGKQGLTCLHLWGERRLRGLRLRSLVLPTGILVTRSFCNTFPKALCMNFSSEAGQALARDTLTAAENR